MADNDPIKEYILGTMTADAQLRFEDKYFADADRFDLLEAAENDLVDSYVRGELSAVERQQFELHYLNSRRRQVDLPFALALAEIAAVPERDPGVPHSSPRFSWRTSPQMSLLALGLVGALIGSACRMCG
jgi:hypothetical protein